jgi:hypothetical protein
MSSLNTQGDAPIDAIYPDVAHPYYIVAPPYARTSAGARVMHLLCHSLNRCGQTAYVMIHPALPWRKDQVAPDLMTPVLTPQVMQSHFDRGLVPIVIYPEFMPGNPFNAPCVVRYVLNFPGLLGGDKDYAPEELCFSYSKVLAETTRDPDNILFLPVSDTRVFRIGPEERKRQGSCFYAHKYKAAHGGELFPITKDSVEIFRDGPHAQTPQEIAVLFQSSEMFYCYENTALATEAVLCGCPAVFLPNPYLSEMIAIKELGPDGFAWGPEPAEIARAKATVSQGRQNYMNTIAAYWRDLDRFIEVSKRHARNRSYAQPMRMPTFADTILLGIRRRGIFGALGKLRHSFNA